MTLYRFNGDLNLPYYDIERFQSAGAAGPAGTLAQGTTLIPCLAMRGGRPLTDSSGTPFVGFEIVVDPRNATPEATARVTDGDRAAQGTHGRQSPLWPGRATT